MRIYAGNLSSEVTERSLRRAFIVFGHVSYVKLNAVDLAIFAMIGMPERIDANRAIFGMNGKLFKGTTIVVKEAGDVSGGAMAVTKWSFYQDRTDRWQWRKFQLGKIVAVSADSFSSREACMLNAGERGYNDEV